MYHAKYLVRLAKVYLDKYEKEGYDAAKAWFNGFLPEDLQEAIRPYVEEEVSRRSPPDNRSN